MSEEGDKDRPTEEVREALQELLQRNERTKGREVGDIYLGEKIFVATIRNTRIIEGEWKSINKTVDLSDLMDDFQNGRS